MGTQGGKRAAACITAALLAGALSACNGGSSASIDTPSGPGGTSSASGGAASSGAAGASTPAASDTTTPDTASSSTEPDGTSATGSSGTAAASGDSAEQDQILAKVIAHAPPKDLVWLVPDVPSSWKKMPNAGEGQLEWNAGDRCAVLLDQPAGIGTQEDPDSKGVLRHTVDRTGQVLPGKPKGTYVAGSQKKRFVPNVVDGLNGTSSVSFEGAVADFGKQGRGRFLAYRNGDFALTFTGVCGTRSGFAKHDAEFNKLIAGLKAHTSY